jgi:hypothetical protein
MTGNNRYGSKGTLRCLPCQKSKRKVTHLARVIIYADFSASVSFLGIKLINHANNVNEKMFVARKSYRRNRRDGNNRKNPYNSGAHLHCLRQKEDIRHYAPMEKSLLNRGNQRYMPFTSRRISMAQLHNITRKSYPISNVPETPFSQCADIVGAIEHNIPQIPFPQTIDVAKHLCDIYRLVENPFISSFTISQESSLFNSWFNVHWVEGKNTRTPRFICVGFDQAEERWKSFDMGKYWASSGRSCTPVDTNGVGSFKNMTEWSSFVGGLFDEAAREVN